MFHNQNPPGVPRRGVSSSWGVWGGVEGVTGVGYLVSLRKSVPTGSESTRATWLPPGSPIRIQNNRTAPPPDPFFKKKLSYGNSVGEKKKRALPWLWAWTSHWIASLAKTALWTWVERGRDCLLRKERKKKRKKRPVSAEVLHRLS